MIKINEQSQLLCPFSILVLKLKKLKLIEWFSFTSKIGFTNFENEGSITNEGYSVLRQSLSSCTKL